MTATGSRSLTEWFQSLKLSVLVFKQWQIVEMRGISFATLGPLILTSDACSLEKAYLNLYPKNQQKIY